jgi:putative AdoMet-dependent methyltransferase
MSRAGEDRVERFDRWAETYDDLSATDSFPRAGYDDVLDAVVRRSEVEPGHCALDIGVGTANLATRIAASGCELWGVDFSAEMLKRARAKLPAARLIEADLRDGWADGLPDRVDRIVSAYVFHEFPDAVKLRLLRELADHLAPDGRIVIGDVAFPDGKSRDDCHEAWRAAWDEDEHYWAADAIRIPLEDAGFAVAYEQVSFCGGVLALRPVG